MKTESIIHEPQPKEKTQISTKELYRENQQRLQNILNWYDIRPDFDKPISQQHISDDENCIIQLKKATHDLAQAALADDNSIYNAFRYFRFLEKNNIIEERAKQGIRSRKSGSINFDLYKEAIKLTNNEEEIMSLFQVVINEDPHLLHLILECTPFIKSKIEAIKKTIDIYSDLYHIPRLPIDDKLTVDFINASGEIAHIDYDCIVGVLNAGAPIPILLDILGKKTGYIEWHRDSEKHPEWRKIGINTHIVIDKPQKILVCENDVSTGTTLEKIIPYLEELNPHQVDVCFHSPAWFPMTEVMSTIPFYANYFHIKTFNKKNFIYHLDQIYKESKVMQTRI